MLKPIREIIPVIEPDPNNKNGYWEVYPDKKVWHEGGIVRERPRDVFEKELVDIINKDEFNEEQYNPMKFKSKQQLDEETHFTLLPQDDYQLIITEVKPEVRNKFQAKPDKDGKIPQEEVVNITLEITGLKDGSPATDKDGANATGRKAFFTFRPQAMGYKEGGTLPSNSRSFLAFVTGQEINGELELESYDTLIGKTVFAEIVEYVNTKGQNRNKISRILPPPKRKK